MLWTRLWAFWGTLPLAGLALLALAHFRWKKRAAARLGDPALLSSLSDPAAPRRQRIKSVLFLAGVLLALVAAAGPRWGRNYQNVRRRGVDVVIAVDVSASMLAEDVAPNRLVQAKRELGLLIEGLKGDRIGLVAFAGDAFLQCPLTLDRSAARSLLDLIEPDLIPTPGTNLAAALRESLNAFPEGARSHKAVVLLTDGEDHSGQLDEAVRRAKEEGAILFPIGFGSPSGEVLPVRDAQGNVVDYKKDKNGKTVVSKLDESSLQDMASRTGGTYQRATQGEVEVDRLLTAIDGMEKKGLEERRLDQTQDRTAWPLSLAILLLLGEFLLPERGSLARLLRGAPLPLLLILAATPGRTAGRRPVDEKAPKETKVTRAWKERAQKNPDDPDVQWNLGHALFQAGDAAGSAQAFDRAKTLAKDLLRKEETSYNAGNALAASKNVEGALEKFKEAMRLNPDDADAKHNYEFLRRQQTDGKKKGNPDKEKERQGKDKEPRGGDKGEDRENARPLKPGDLSKEDAERILQAVERQEKEARQKVKMPESKRKTEEDW